MAKAYGPWPVDPCSRDQTEVDGIAVEVYATKRYMTVPESSCGHGFTGQIQDLPSYSTYSISDNYPRRHKKHRNQETHEPGNQASGIHPVDVHINDLPSSCIPTSLVNETRPFELARYR